jgi:hypothetical protein
MLAEQRLSKECRECDASGRTLIQTRQLRAHAGNALVRFLVFSQLIGVVPAGKDSQSALPARSACVLRARMVAGAGARAAAAGFVDYTVDMRAVDALQKRFTCVTCDGIAARVADERETILKWRG